MTLEPLLSAPLTIQIHAFAALAAAVIAPLQFLARKGSPLHRVDGYLWVVLMATDAASTLWIHELRIFGPWSPIHLISLWVLIGLPRAVLYARRGEVEAHRRIMRNMAFGALVIAGAFTLLPGRIMHQVLFGS